jgi:O-antigen/teichoic acid export membrane protein
MVTAGYMRFGSAGLKSAFQKYVAEATGTGDFQTANKLLSTGSISMLVLSLLGLMPIAIYSTNLARASGVPAMFVSSAAGSITLLAAIMVLSNFGSAFEAILMGAHRIDITRTFNTIASIAEAVVIVVLLNLGFGLIAMAATIATSELLYVLCCFIASRRVLPEIRISLSSFSKNVFGELIRFAGSYQLVNILEVLYGMLLPVIVLKFFGAELAGVYAVATRIVTGVLMGQDALVLPLLSGASLIFTSGSHERIAKFLEKSFKITLAVSLIPLAFVSMLGALLVLAWTGQTNSEFPAAIGLTCLYGMLGSVSRIQLVVYRAAGHALHDNIRQIFYLGLLAALGLFASRIGFNGVLIGIAAGAFIGVIYMFRAIHSAFRFFDLRQLMQDVVKLSLAAAALAMIGFAASRLPVLGNPSERIAALVHLSESTVAFGIALWPVLVVTGAITGTEQQMLLNLLLPWKKAAAHLSD